MFVDLRRDFRPLVVRSASFVVPPFVVPPFAVRRSPFPSPFAVPVPPLVVLGSVLSSSFLVLLSLMPLDLIIAIDGPSGAGKGTLARALASALGYRHVDTGAMYRAVAWKALHDGMPLDDEARLAALAARASIEQDGSGCRIDGHDVTAAIRTPEIDKAAAAVARLAAVRTILVARQRALGAARRVVMEGRDIGTVVFPQADIKVYLDASEEERARRRAADPAHTSGRTAGVAAVQTALQARDKSDTTRAVAPLTVAEDALYIDTTGVPVEAVVEQVMRVVEDVKNRG
jgi:cytidylate kinase